MLLKEPVYDLDILSQSNLHIHTDFSGCAKTEMTFEDIVKTAVAAGLSAIAITDHFNDNITDRDFIDHINRLRQEALALKPNIKILFSGELSAYASGKTLESEEVRAALDYRLYSCNHFHLSFWGQPEDKSPRGYALYALDIVDGIIETGFADCIAHPMIGRFVKAFEDRCVLTAAISDNELGELMEKSVEFCTAWEINVGAILGDPVFGRRLWNIGKETGAYFNYGTDAHRLENIDTKKFLPEIKKILM